MLPPFDLSPFLLKENKYLYNCTCSVLLFQKQYKTLLSPACFSLFLLLEAGAGLFQLVVTEFVFSKIINYAALRAAQIKAKVILRC